MSGRKKPIKQASAGERTKPGPQVKVPKQTHSDTKIWAFLLHLGVNMWKKHYPDLQLSDPLWNDALKKMSEVGLNMIVIDLGDAIVYNTHPEIAVNNAWTTQKLREELKKIRELGLEPIPKMNFSTCHDSWLGDYGRMVSTEKYYAICRDLIREAIDLFDHPRFFHLGMDEENESNQRDFDYMVIRQKELYWGDLYFLFGEVLKKEVRPWVWQDYIRYHPETFARMMPKYVVQSNWYNGTDLVDPKTNYAKISVKAYTDLETLGYDQIPGGSNYYEGTDECFINNVKFCTKKVADQRLLGFIQSPWKFTTEKNRGHILKSIELAGQAKKWFDNQR